MMICASANTFPVGIKSKIKVTFSKLHALKVKSSAG
jgi:hypothetical protein